MILFNELRITPDGKCLVIDASIEDMEYFKEVTIDSIFVDTHKTWMPNGPSQDAIMLYGPGMHNLDVVNDGNGRHVRIDLENGPFMEINSSTMYFVYVIANVENAPNYSLAPCSCNMERIMGTVVNTYPLYKILTSKIRSMADDCSKSNEFADSFLRIQAIESSIKSGNYPMAIKYWSKFFSNARNDIGNHKHCGCHGGY